MQENRVVVYTDGACRGNPGIGGWGAILQFRDKQRELKGAAVQTTNNRMELMAAIKALETLKRPCQVELHTDSQYLRLGITRWLQNWKQKNWKTSNRRAVKNQDLWQQLDAEAVRHQMNWLWVKAHAGVPGNERADALANAAIDEFLASQQVKAS